MTDDPPNPPKKSWRKRLYQTFLSAPKDREHLISLLRKAQKRDFLERDALLMVEGVLQVSDMCVSEIMVPREKMVVIDKEKNFEDILPLVTKSTHSRFPILGENKDEVLGILLAKDLLSYATTDTKFNIRDNLRPVVFVPENKRLNILLHEFRKNRNHLAIVVNEYGNITGLVTIEDVLEQIVGDIEDEHDIIEAHPIQKHKDNQYSVQALTTIHDFNEYFQTDLSDEAFDTIGGLVMQAFGHLPKRGESVNINNVQFTILKANDRRIQLLKTQIKKSTQQDDQNP